MADANQQDQQQPQHDISEAQADTAPATTTTTTSNLDFLAAVTAGIPQDGWAAGAGAGAGAGEGMSGEGEREGVSVSAPEGYDGAGAGESKDTEKEKTEKTETEAETETSSHNQTSPPHHQIGNSSVAAASVQEEDEEDDYDPSNTVTDHFSAPPPPAAFSVLHPQPSPHPHPQTDPVSAPPRPASSTSSSSEGDFATALRNKGVGAVATAPAPQPVSATVSAPISVAGVDVDVNMNMDGAATTAATTAAATESNDDEYEPSASAPVMADPAAAATEQQQQQIQRQSENENTSADLSNVIPPQPRSQPTSTSIPASTAAAAPAGVSASASDSYSPQLSAVYNPALPTVPETQTQPQPQTQTQTHQPPSIPPSRASFRETSQSQSAAPTYPSTPTTAPHKPKGRLPTDVIGVLEDRISADATGDVDAWLELIEEYKRREKLDCVRDTYERFFKIFPFAADQWVSYATFESTHNELYRLEQIFNKSLLHVPHVSLWSLYLDYIRRRHNLSTADPTALSTARAVISSAYDFALQKIGIDRDSAPIWTDYIAFIRSGPGIIGGASWQDQQKMDTLRKAYHRAIAVPHAAVTALWKEYDQFEMGLNKLTGRKFVQERSRGYMTARMSFVELGNITRGLVRSTLPRYPPLAGCVGHEEFQGQLRLWRRWVRWEIEDPLVLKEEEPEAYRARVVYVFKQALMAMRFVPELWFEAAQFCFENGSALESEGEEFLKLGLEANPTSTLLAFKRADRLERTTRDEHDALKRGGVVREPYDRVLDALYAHLARTREKEAEEVKGVEEWFAGMKDVSEYVPSGPHVRSRDSGKKKKKNKASSSSSDDDDDSDADDDAQRRDGENDPNDSSGANTPTVDKAKETAKQNELDAVHRTYAPRARSISKLISYTWIALMRCMRRIQGKGKPGENAGSRQIFAEARKRGRITCDVYIASALLEHHCYNDPAATKIFERGSKLFPDDEQFTLKYLQHLIDIHDITNARAVFEKSTRRLAGSGDAATVRRAKVLFEFMHAYESRYGDMVQIESIEARMRELFPPSTDHDDDDDDDEGEEGENPLARFESRFRSSDFDPARVTLVLSPSQVRVPPLQSATGSRAQSVEILDGAPSSTRFGGNTGVNSTGYTGYTDSPKRPYDYDSTDEYARPPRKYMRGESPGPGQGSAASRLKGAAGRRVDQNKRQQQHASHPSLSGNISGGSGSGGGNMMRGSAAPPVMSMMKSGGGGGGVQPQPLPQEIMYLLSIIPPAHTYEATRLNAEKMVALLRGIDVRGVGGGVGRRY